MKAEASKESPPKGSLVRDRKTGKVGTVMDVDDSRLWLRKTGGGTEWNADVANVEPVKLSDHLADRIREERRKRVPR